MQIFLLRHGEAEGRKTSDEERALTAKGRADVNKTVVESLTDLKTLQQIWVSPLVRAQQTAAIVNDVLLKHGVRLLTSTTDLLQPESEPNELISALEKNKTHPLLLVSHQPLLGSLLGLVCSTPETYCPMHTSSLAYLECINLAAKMGHLRWLRHVND